MAGDSYWTANRNLEDSSLRSPENDKAKNRPLSGCVLAPLRFRVGSGPTPRSSSNFLPFHAGSLRRSFRLSTPASLKLAFLISFEHRPRARVLHPACTCTGRRTTQRSAARLYATNPIDLIVTRPTGVCRSLSPTPLALNYAEIGSLFSL